MDSLFHLRARHSSFCVALLVGSGRSPHTRSSLHPIESRGKGKGMPFITIATAAATSLLSFEVTSWLRSLFAWSYRLAGWMLLAPIWRFGFISFHKPLVWVFAAWYGHCGYLRYSRCQWTLEWFPLPRPLDASAWGGTSPRYMVPTWKKFLTELWEIEPCNANPADRESEVTSSEVIEAGTIKSLKP